MQSIGDSDILAKTKIVWQRTIDLVQTFFTNYEQKVFTPKPPFTCKDQALI